MARRRHLPLPIWNARSLFDAVDAHKAGLLPEGVSKKLAVSAEVLAWVDRKLAEPREWRSSALGYGVKEQPQPTPRDGRVGGYPGTGVPGASRDPDNQAHLRWALMFVSTLYEMRVPYTKVAKLAGMDNETLKDLLTGVRYGLAETRVRATWALYFCMLTNGFSLQSLLVWVDSDGNWTPHRPLVSNWGFDSKGFVTAQPVLPTRTYAQ